MAEIPLPKFQQLMTELYIIPMGMMRIGTTPYEKEWGSSVVHPEGAMMVELIPEFYNNVSAGGCYNPTTNTYDRSDILNFMSVLKAADLAEGRSIYYFSSYANHGVGCWKWLTFNGAGTSSTGWECSFDVEAGNEGNHGIFQPGRKFGVWVTQWADDPTQAPLFNCVCMIVAIKYNGGVTVTTQSGRSIAKIQCATLDHFLDVPLKKLDFFNLEQATAERAAWAAEPDKTGQPYPDPFRGFGSVVDTMSFPVGADIPVPPANETHLIHELSLTKALKHILDSHVAVSMGGGQFERLSRMFSLDMDMSLDIETKLMTVTKDDGSLLGSMTESSKHGVWRFWCTSLSNLIYTKDYCSRPNDMLMPESTHFTLMIEAGQSLLGELTVVPGRRNTRISRVEVSGNPQLAESGQELTSLNYFINYGQSTFPKRSIVDDLDGTIHPISGYQGHFVYHQARCMWAQLSQETTASLTSYPFANIFTLFNRVVSIKGKDPQGLYDYSQSADAEYQYETTQGNIGDFFITNAPVAPAIHGRGTYDYLGKRFSVVGCSVNYKSYIPGDNTMGVLDCTLNLKEIVYFPMISSDQSLYDPHLIPYTAFPIITDERAY